MTGVTNPTVVPEWAKTAAAQILHDYHVKELAARAPLSLRPERDYAMFPEMPGERIARIIASHVPLPRPTPTPVGEEAFTTQCERDKNGCPMVLDVAQKEWRGLHRRCSEYEAKLVTAAEDRKLLDWLIAHGYAPAEWGPWSVGDPPSRNGLKYIGPATRETVRSAVARSVARRKWGAT